ncbi:MAG: M1 family aminopeptidase [Bacteroidota bacterium]
MNSRGLNVFLIAVVLFSACKPVHTASVNHADANHNNRKVDIPVYQASRTKYFDLVNTVLKVQFDWNKRFLYGRETVTLKPHFYPQQELILNARGMIINAVDLYTKDGINKLSYIYKNDSLVITLDRIYRRDEELQIQIDYVARPDELVTGGSEAITSDKGLYFINPDGIDPYKPKQIWTQGETESSSAWFPTIDAPNQKMTQDIYITVDSVYQTLSNGLLISSTINNDGSRTDYWKQTLPHAPYLAMMVVGQFSVIKDKWRDKEVTYYVEPQYAKPAVKIFGNTPQMMEFFSNRLGVPFPWEKYAQIVVRDYVSGSMENSSATLHGDFMQRDEREMIDFDGEEYVSHELFHQWFGDLVTCESWSNTPLNESFATYGEYLWNEYHFGRDTADSGLNNDLNKYLHEARTKQVDLIRFNYDDKEDMFDRHSYEKGGCVLNMLRRYTGDDAFFASLQLYLNRCRFKTAEIHDLRLAFEEITGEDLNWFFNQWFFNKGHPELDITYKWNAATQEESVTVKQEQNPDDSPIYKLPVAIDIYNGDNVERKKLVINSQEQTYTFHLDSKPDVVNFDAEKMLVCTKKDHHMEEEWISLYNKGKVFNDRLEALNAVTKDYPVPSSVAELMKKALDDKNKSLRARAISNTERLFSSGDSLWIRQKLIQMAEKDQAANVRNAALRALINSSNKINIDDLLVKAVKDSSYNVSSTALNAYTKLYPEKGLLLAHSMENINSNPVSETLMELYSVYGGSANADYLHQAVQRVTGFDKYQAVQRYSRFLNRITDRAILQQGIDYIYKVGAEDNVWYIRIAAVQTLIELKTDLKSKKDVASVQQIEDAMAAIKSKEKDSRVLRLLE